MSIQISISEKHYETKGNIGKCDMILQDWMINKIKTYQIGEFGNMKEKRSSLFPLLVGY